MLYLLVLTVLTLNGGEMEESKVVSSGSDIVLDVRHLFHSFKRHAALKGVSFQVRKNSIHGFVGPNGAGKTTTLKLVATLLKPQGASVIKVFGKDVSREYKSVRRDIGFMPDHFSMYKRMTVYEYLDFFAAAYGLGLKERDAVLGDLLELTDMGGRKNDLIKGLSRGMQQRVNLARVLVHDPKLLLLDEPASGLDPRARIELMEILRELRGMGKTIFISSHILSELAELCDSVTIIDAGKTRFAGRMDDLLTMDRGEDVGYSLTLREAVEGLEGKLSALDGVEVSEVSEDGTVLKVTMNESVSDQGAVFGLLASSGAKVIDFHEERKHLNQAFMDLTEAGVRA
jgi:ABC-2 type transport system ATP-binding protein